MMDWNAKIKEWFQHGVWTEEMVKNAVKAGKITAEQMTEILAS